MNVDKAQIGHSFKGAFAYYFHDKAAPGEPHRQTAERIAWTEARNLASDDPAFALSVMMATARSADELKRAAGVKATGRKVTTGPVYALSLAWEPDAATGLDRAEMIRAADDVLSLLDAKHLQAVIVAHNDTAHPHVHIIINRIDPATGKAAGFNNDLHKLDEWADRYERGRGKIVSPNRAKKYDDRRAREKAQEGERRAPAEQPAKTQTAPQAPEKSAAALLAQRQAEQRDRHRQEWAAYAEQTKAERAAVYAERIDFKAIAARHRDEQRPAWSALGKRQAAERRAFHANEKRLAGIIRNAIDVVRSQKIRGLGDDRGFLTMCFNFTINTKARHAAFAERQAAEKGDLKRQGDDVLKLRFEAAKAGRTGKLATLAQQQSERRATLAGRQDKEKAEVRDGWRKVYADRAKAAELARHTDHSRDRMARMTDQNLRYTRRLERVQFKTPAAPAPDLARADPQADFALSAAPRSAAAFQKAAAIEQQPAQALASPGMPHPTTAQQAASGLQQDWQQTTMPPVDQDEPDLPIKGSRGRSKAGRGKGRVRTRSREIE